MVFTFVVACCLLICVGIVWCLVLLLRICVDFCVDFLLGFWFGFDVACIVVIVHCDFVTCCLLAYLLVCFLVVAGVGVDYCLLFRIVWAAGY